MIRCKPTEFIDMDDARLMALLGRLETKDLAEGDFETLSEMAKSYYWVTRQIDKKAVSIARLRQMLFGAATESTSLIVGRGNNNGASTVGASTVGASTVGTSTAQAKGPDSPAGPIATPSPTVPSSPPAKPKAKGHGRKGVADFPGATHVTLVHPELSSRDKCPKCQFGTVYESRPQSLLRFIGQAPITAQVYYRQTMRCDICGECYVAPLPEGVTQEKYDATVVSVIGLLKYGRGMPFNRLDELQDDLGQSLSASTQWELVFGASPIFSPVYEELIRQAAQGEIMYNDDTTVKILELTKKGSAAPGVPSASDAQAATGSTASDEYSLETSNRTGIFTSGIVSTLSDQHKVALFFSGRNHAGENLTKVLRQRAEELPPPIQMCDALSRNYPKEFETIVANCLAHARRKFVEQHPRFQDECRWVLEQFEQVYIHDDHARKAGLSAEQRLTYHQTHSRSIMDGLRTRMKDLIDEKQVESNSGLGGAINYLLKHWEKLTLFHRVAGAPLDNNIVERALKKAILHRKNALFYKTQRGADVGDMYMSLIFTCDMNAVNPFEYLTQLQLQADEVQAAPDRWLPWNYRDTLHNVRASPAIAPPNPASG